MVGNFLDEQLTSMHWSWCPEFDEIHQKINTWPSLSCIEGRGWRVCIRWHCVSIFPERGKAHKIGFYNVLFWLSRPSIAGSGTWCPCVVGAERLSPRYTWKTECFWCRTNTRVYSICKSRIWFTLPFVCIRFEARPHTDPIFLKSSIHRECHTSQQWSKTSYNCVEEILNRRFLKRRCG